MGIIKRQGIKSSIVYFAGAIIGALAIFFVYPLDNEIYGYAQFLYNTAYLFIPLGTMGGLSIIVRYFPKFNSDDSDNYNGFLSLVLSILSLAFAVFVILWYFFSDFFLSYLQGLNMDTAKIADNEIYIILLLGCLILLNLFTAQSSNKLRIVVPHIIQTLGFKLFLPALVLAYVYLEFSESQFAFSIVAFFGVAALLVLLYLRLIDGVKFGKIRKPTNDFSYKEMAKYSLFGTLNALSNGIALRTDSIMIPLLLTYAKNGAYGMASFISNVIEIPTKSITQIAGPIISKAWEEDNLIEIDTIYKKASVNLFMIGSLLFLGIWYLIDDLISLSTNPESFINARMIFFFLGIGKLIDMITSVNTQIIVYSEKYKFNLLFLSILAVSNIILNFIMIPRYGIVGAAIATTISMVAYNIMKVVFIYKSFNLHPFSQGSFKILLLLVTLTLGFYIFPTEWHPIVSILVKGSFVTLIFLPIAYFWNISEDANELVRSTLRKFIKLK
jgi:O-antigen/teichoic acid export membrane protein